MEILRRMKKDVYRKRRIGDKLCGRRCGNKERVREIRSKR